MTFSTKLAHSPARDSLGEHRRSFEDCSENFPARGSGAIQTSAGKARPNVSELEQSQFRPKFECGRCVEIPLKSIGGAVPEPC